MHHTLATLCLFVLSGTGLAVPAAAQSLHEDLATLVETPAVTGYEQALAEKIRERARAAGYALEQDHLGTLYVTLGSGAPHRLVVAPVDEPGYIVSHITDNGYLRVQRLPQSGVHPLFEQLHAAQPVVIHTREGRWVSGVVAGLSTHLQGGRRTPPRVAHPDEVYVDIGAASAEDVRRAGVGLLDPIALERQLLVMGFGKVTAPYLGDRFGAAALLELLRRVDRTRLRGTLTVAFLAQQWTNSRGLDRLTQRIRADELVYVGRLRPRGAGTAAMPEPGAGVLLAMERSEAAPGGFAGEMVALAETHKIPLRPVPAAPLPRASYTGGPELPARMVQLSIPLAWPVTPAEMLDFADLGQLSGLLEAYASGEIRNRGAAGDAASPGNRLPGRPTAAPQMPELLRNLVEAYGVSGHEGPVRERIADLLPPWAKPETDDAGNLILRIGDAPAGSRVPRIAFVAHMDEIGFVVESVAPDGRLVVRSRGGGILQFFAGHALLVHTVQGPRAAVLELPAGWEEPEFDWPRGPASVLRVDVGARTPEQVAELGIRVGDSLTVPKKYRPLFGTRANGRSFDDRVGSAALIAAAWALGPNLTGREVLLAWVTEEEVGLRGAFALATRLAREGRAPDYVFAVDTFVSSDSPLEEKRFGYGEIGKGFVVRAVDNSNIVRRELVDRVLALAQRHGIPAQFGVTGGGNDGAAFLRSGTVDIPLGWPLRYSHSPGEVIDVRDAEALARMITVLAREW
ncbi:MAG: M20/M25/M40 family metallo-hydrolase [Firmicutes bacterium]|nr:M20/M25/M40 family metallo-hydrolase [Bacillota bacterium]